MNEKPVQLSGIFFQPEMGGASTPPELVTYRSVVFLSGDDATECLTEFLDIEDGYIIHGLTEESADAALDYLMQWEYGEGELTTWEPWGTSDEVLVMDETRGYVISWNSGLGYIALTQKLTHTVTRGNFTGEPSCSVCGFYFADDHDAMEGR